MNEAFDLSELSEDERIAYAQFEETYMQQNPPPDLPRRINWKDAGILYLMTFVVAIGALALTAFRTGLQFYAVAALEWPWYIAVAQAGFAIIAIDGFLVTLAASKASKRNYTSPTWINIGMIIMLFISFMAGIGQSINLVDYIPEAWKNDFKIGLAFALALASLVAYVSGEVMGQQIAELDIDFRKRMDIYKAELAEYTAKKERRWLSHPSRSLTYGKLKNIAENEKSANERSVPFSMRQNEHQPPIRISELRPKVFNFLDEQEKLFNQGKIEHLPSVREVADSLDCSVGSVSKWMNEWKSTNGNGKGG